MMLYFTNYLERSGLTVEALFRVAYMYTFRKDVDISDHVREYRVSGIIPKFVVFYVQNNPVE